MLALDARCAVTWPWLEGMLQASSCRGDWGSGPAISIRRGASSLTCCGDVALLRREESRGAHGSEHQAGVCHQQKGHYGPGARVSMLYGCALYEYSSSQARVSYA